MTDTNIYAAGSSDLTITNAGNITTLSAPNGTVNIGSNDAGSVTTEKLGIGLSNAPRNSIELSGNISLGDYSQGGEGNSRSVGVFHDDSDPESLLCGMEIENSTENPNQQRLHLRIHKDNFSSDRRLTIHENGNIGVGVALPHYFLHVDSMNSGSIFYGRYMDVNGYHGGTHDTAPALYAGSIAAGKYIAISDMRKKTDIVSLPDENSLELFRSLNQVSFYYKDPIDNLQGKQYGFIAQEVEKVMPSAINTQTNKPHYICDINDHVDNPIWEENSLVYDISFSECNNRFVRFYVSNNSDESDVVQKDIECVNGRFTFDKQYKNVYVYGRAILDLKAVDYQAMNTVLFSATQELDKNVQKLETENTLLKERLAAIEAKLGM